MMMMIVVVDSSPLRYCFLIPSILPLQLKRRTGLWMVSLWWILFSFFSFKHVSFFFFILSPRKILVQRGLPSVTSSKANRARASFTLRFKQHLSVAGSSASPPPREKFRPQRWYLLRKGHCCWKTVSNNSPGLFLFSSVPTPSISFSLALSLPLVFLLFGSFLSLRTGTRC